jgi:hypothetical protein
MKDELAKTISTCAIWLATAVILTFGLFRMTGNAFFFLCATGVIAGAACIGTAVVWLPMKDGGSTDAASSPRSGPGERNEPTQPPTRLPTEPGITSRPGG